MIEFQSTIEDFQSKDESKFNQNFHKEESMAIIKEEVTEKYRDGTTKSKATSIRIFVRLLKINHRGIANICSLTSILTR